MDFINFCREFLILLPYTAYYNIYNFEITSVYILHRTVVPYCEIPNNDKSMVYTVLTSAGEKVEWDLCILWSTRV